MTVPALTLKRSALRVAIVATDIDRRRELESLVAEQGHIVEKDEETADVLLADGDIPISEKPVVTFDAEYREQAGNLPRIANAAQVDAALRAVAAGLIVRAAESGRAFRAVPHRESSEGLLTPREVEILSSIAAGLSNKAIAQHLDISLHTVKFHVESLFGKLGVRSRAEAVAKGLERRRAEIIDL
jgi:DNA-binding CsgD family transcriptional regulator